MCSDFKSIHMVKWSGLTQTEKIQYDSTAPCIKKSYADMIYAFAC